MTSQRITRMPFVDGNNTLVGLLDQEAILSYYADLPEVAHSISQTAPAPQTSRPQTVGEASLTQVPLVDLASSFPEILHRIQETPLRRVIVVDRNGKAVGVIGDNDVLASQGTATHSNPLLALAGRYMPNIPEELVRRRSSQRLLTAQQIMRPRLFTVTPATSLLEAVHLMLSNHIKRLVIVNEAGRPLGLVDQQQAQLLRLASDIRQEIAQLAADYAIASKESNLMRTIASEFTLLWCDLEDVRPPNLRNYGFLNPQVNAILGPHIQHLIDLTLTVDRVANDQELIAMEQAISESQVKKQE